jgi:hypothetical protein
MTSLTPDQPEPVFARPSEEEVERVICASLVSDTRGVYATMEQIRESAMRHNPLVGIHAALVYQSGWFVYWIEGSKGVVRELLERISLDSRHQAQYVVHRSSGRHMLMTPWSMMLSPSREGREAFGRRVIALSEQVGRGTPSLPTSVIRRLVMPMRLTKVLRSPDPDAYHRVVFCAATGDGAFGLVRWLSDQYGTPVESRRHAGTANLDSASAYVEFLHSGYPCRVIAVARSNLTHGLHRSLLQDWRFLVLLFSGDPKRDAALLERVHEAFQGMPSTPEVLAISPDAQTQALVDDVARTYGLAYLEVGHLSEQDSAAIWFAVRDRLDQIGAPRPSV